MATAAPAAAAAQQVPVRINMDMQLKLVPAGSYKPRAAQALLGQLTLPMAELAALLAFDTQPKAGSASRPPRRHLRPPEHAGRRSHPRTQ